MKKNPPQDSEQGTKTCQKTKKGAPATVSRNMQVFRIARIVSLLKRNCCPTANELLKEYRNLSIGEGKLLRGNYSVRTVYRDIDALRNEFDCPIRFNRHTNTYYLEDRNWDFNCPANLSETAMLALIVGGRIAEEVFPEPFRARIKKSVDEILKGNSAEFLEKTLISSLKVFEQGGVAANPEVFSPVFKAWQTHHRLHIIYKDQHGNESERDVDPHVLFLYQHEWRISAFCHVKKQKRTFVINRIKNAYILKETFTPDKNLIDSVTLNSIVEYEKLKNVKIKLTGDAVMLAKSTSMHTRQRIKETKDGGLFFIPEIAAEIIVPWLLSQGGEAVPLEPPELIDVFRRKVQALSHSLPPEH
jgi:predicted DNA-binding transcriptional regulator YafY